VLFDERAQLPALITSLRGFIQVLAEVASHEEFDLPDGSRLAAVKFAFGGGSVFREETNNPDATLRASAGGPATEEGLLGIPIVDLPAVKPGADGVLDVLRGLLR
jgi:hypothetical protein